MATEAGFGPVGGSGGPVRPHSWGPERARSQSRSGVGLRIGATLGFIGLGALVVAIVTSAGPSLSMARVSATPLPTVRPQLVVAVSPARSVDSYVGLGAWVDSYDAVPAYSQSEPTVGVVDLAQMAAYGVRTVFLQAARSGDRSGLATSDPWVLTEFLLHAHRKDMDVVAWYLPMWKSDGQDLERLLALHQFEVLGHRFDGLAVDIEWTGGGLEHHERSARLEELVGNLREETGTDPLGGIVMPPLLTDEINPSFWPDFPWIDLSDKFDVWLPMSYWSFRTEEHADPYFYSAENIRMLRDHLKDPSALVHGIGGIGAADGAVTPDSGEPLATIAELDAFVASLDAVEAIGGSIYDWATTGSRSRERLEGLMEKYRIGHNASNTVSDK